ncbi:MAG: di-trans,poly-cis-decaprenylcistransferase, partial [Planctomycetes bacterium]|nr:di-trans,poly-cis-decaprenylcistransferase [Planctomycetota bacterium]
MSAPSEIPRHVAIIMDGNGRWAESRGFPRVAGHRAGALAIRPVLKRASELGVEVLTLYSFSSENWNRPTDEVDALMELCCEKLAQERESLVEMGVRLRRIGKREGLPARVLYELDETEAATADGRKITLALALNYGSRGEI